MSLELAFFAVSFGSGTASGPSLFDFGTLLKSAAFKPLPEELFQPNEPVRRRPKCWCRSGVNATLCVPNLLAALERQPSCLPLEFGHVLLMLSVPWSPPLSPPLSMSDDLGESYAAGSTLSHPRQHRHDPSQKLLSRITLCLAQSAPLHRQIQIRRDLHRRTFGHVKKPAMIQFGIAPIALGDV